MYLSVHCSTIYDSQDMKWPSKKEWIMKLWHTYTIEYYSAIKKEWNNVIFRNMGRPKDCHIKLHKSERERQISWYLFYVEFIKNDTNVLIYKAEIES